MNVICQECRGLCGKANAEVTTFTPCKTCGGSGQQPILELEEYWALWRDLTEQARVLNEAAAQFRKHAKSSGHYCGMCGWQQSIKTAIKRERKARHLLERAKMFKAIYWEMKK